MNNKFLPDLGIYLQSSMPKYSFYVCTNYSINSISFETPEYISVIADVKIDNNIYLANFDFDISDFDKYVYCLPDQYKRFKDEYKGVYKNCSKNPLVLKLRDNYVNDTIIPIYGYISNVEIDGNGLQFVPLKSFELIKNNIPHYISTKERLLKQIAIELILLYAIDTKELPGFVDYVKAMLTLDTMDDYYGSDDGEIITLHLVNYMKGWNSPGVKQLKDELKKMHKKRKLI
jgi:hypothetical protein